MKFLKRIGRFFTPPIKYFAVLGISAWGTLFIVIVVLLIFTFFSQSESIPEDYVVKINWSVDEKIVYDIQMTSHGDISFDERGEYVAIPLPDETIALQPTSEKDLEKIAGAFLGYISDSSAEDFRLISITYYGFDCNDIASGYTHAHFVYEHSIKTDDGYDSDGYNLDIFPWDATIVSQAYHYSSDKLIPNQNHIVFDALPVNAFDVFEIAENNGGYETRTQEENRYCEVLLRLGDKNDDPWEVIYTGKHGVTFEAQVDRESGKFKKFQ